MTKPASEKPKRRVVTCERVSSESQRERETIKTQTEALAQRLAIEHDIEVVGRFVDDGVSGRNALAKRIGGAELLRAAEAHLFDELWVYDPSRLGRNLADMAMTVDRLHDLGITIWSVTRGKLDKFQFKLMALLAEDEADRISDRFGDGLNRAAREGRYPGGVVAYGFKVVGVKPDARLAPDRDPVHLGLSPADVVTRMYERVALDDWSCRKVADEFNALGIPTHSQLDGPGTRKKGTSATWGEGRVRNMLVMPLYKGVQVYGQRSRRTREVVTGAIEPIVSEGLWDAAQAALGRHRICPKNSDRVDLLRTVMVC